MRRFSICILMWCVVTRDVENAYNPCTHIKGETGLNFFESQHPSGEWIVMNCALGTAYNKTTCSCSDFAQGCKLTASSSQNTFYFFLGGKVQFKTCPFGTVFKQDMCGCYQDVAKADNKGIF